jgi:hypothetical protein
METVFFTDQFSEEHKKIFLTAICFSVDSTEFLANFLFERADLLDEQVLKERDEMIRKRQEEKKANARKGAR